MIINKINKIKNYRTFRNYTWPADLAGFGRYNLLYGWNGSGKTTITNIFQAIEKRESISEGEIAVGIDESRINCGNITNDILLPNIRVFNETFVKQNIFTDEGSVSPIYYIGEATKEKKKILDGLIEQKKSRDNEYEKQRQSESKAEQVLDRFCKDNANNRIKPILSSAGDNPYNNYNKTSFKNESERLLSEQNADAYILSQEDEFKYREQKEANPKDKINVIIYDFNNMKELYDEVLDILKKTVISQIISEYKDDQELAAWVKTGLEKHKKEKIDICLFCGQKIPEGRIKNLEGHFNAQYNKFISDIDQKVEGIEILIKNCSAIITPDEARVYDHLKTSYTGAVVEFKDQIEQREKFLLALQQSIKEKKGKPFQPLNLDLDLQEIDVTKLDLVNSIISQHNRETDDFEKTVSNARERIEESIIASLLPEYKEKKKAVEEAKQAYIQNNKQIEGLSRKIADLEQDIIEHRRPAEELNDDLKSYLGHGDIVFETRETGYQIMRNGVVADNLSEGERDAIAFLYFLKSLGDRDFSLKDGVVVIDDPVSSLDSNFLFCAFGFMKERTKKAGQLFVFTHDFSFFRQVKNWFHYLNRHKKIEDRPARLYMVCCNLENQNRCSTITKLHPLLDKYESEYSYLFNLIYKQAYSTDSELENCYFIPNIARRVLEAFLSFKHPADAGNLYKQIESIDFKLAKKSRILRFINTYSHSGQIEQPEHDLSILSETGAILKDVLELIKHEDEQHYNEMVQLVSD